MNEANQRQKCKKKIQRIQRDVFTCEKSITYLKKNKFKNIYYQIKERENGSTRYLILYFIIFYDLFSPVLKNLKK